MIKDKNVILLRIQHKIKNLLENKHKNQVFIKDQKHI